MWPLFGKLCLELGHALRSHANVPSCRFCLGWELSGKLCTPCDCQGTSKHIHADCLRKWQKAVGPESVQHDTCPTCGTRYRECGVQEVNEAMQLAHPFDRWLADPRNGIKQRYMAIVWEADLRLQGVLQRVKRRWSERNTRPAAAVPPIVLFAGSLIMEIGLKVGAGIACMTLYITGTCRGISFILIKYGFRETKLKVLHYMLMSLLHPVPRIFVFLGFFRECPFKFVHLPVMLLVAPMINPLLLCADLAFRLGFIAADALLAMPWVLWKLFLRHVSPRAQPVGAAGVDQVGGAGGPSLWELLEWVEPGGAAGVIGVGGLGGVDGAAGVKGVGGLIEVDGVGAAAGRDVVHARLRAQHETFYHETHWSLIWSPVFFFMVTMIIAGIVQSICGYFG